MGAAGRQRVESEYALNRTAQRMMAISERLVKE
jgi:hypothetical protein